METGDYLLFGFIIVLVIGGLIINPVIAIAIIFFLYVHSRVQKQKEEQSKNAELQRWRQEKRIDANLDAVNKKVARKEEKAINNHRSTVHGNRL